MSDRPLITEPTVADSIKFKKHLLSCGGPSPYPEPAGPQPKGAKSEPELTFDGRRTAVAAIMALNNSAQAWGRRLAPYSIPRAECQKWNAVAATAATLDTTPEMFVTVVHAVTHMVRYPRKFWGQKAVGLYREHEATFAKRVAASLAIETESVEQLLWLRRFHFVDETETEAAHAILSYEPTEVNPVLRAGLAERMRFDDIRHQVEARACEEYINKRHFYDKSWAQVLPTWLPRAADVYTKERASCLRIS